LRYLGVVVDDIKTSYAIIRELKRMSIPFVLLKVGEPVPPHVSASILCGSIPMAGYNRAVRSGSDARGTVLRALSMASGREAFGQVIIGIDPGDSAGIAVIADGELIEAYTVGCPLLAEELERILKTISAGQILFRIGRGDLPLEALTRLQQDPRASLVFISEAKRRLPPAFDPKGLKKDARSALKIALTADPATTGARHWAEWESLRRRH